MLDYQEILIYNKGTTIIKLSQADYRKEDIVRANEIVDFLKHFSGQELEKIDICIQNNDGSFLDIDEFYLVSKKANAVPGRKITLYLKSCKKPF